MKHNILYLVPFLLGVQACTPKISEGQYIHRFEILDIKKNGENFTLNRQGISKIGTLTRVTTIPLKTSGEKLAGSIPGGFLPRKIEISYLEENIINVAIDKKTFKYQKIETANLHNEPVAGSSERFQAFLEGLLPTKTELSLPTKCHKPLLDHAVIRSKILEKIRFHPIDPNKFSKASNLFATTYYYRIVRPEQSHSVEVLVDEKLCDSATAVCIPAQKPQKITLQAKQKTNGVTMYFHRFATLRNLEQTFEVLDQHLSSYDEAMREFVCDWRIKI